MKYERKNTKLYFFLWILLASTGIITFFTSNSFKFSPVKETYDNSMKNSEILPHMSLTIAWNDNGNPVCTESSDQDGIQFCSDGSGGAIVAWYQYSASTNDDVYVQRIDFAGNVKWTTNGVILCVDNYKQIFPQICSDGAGGAIIVWQDKRNGIDYDIYAQHINSDGTINWTAYGVPICTYSDNQIKPQICSDEAGGAIIIWQDSRPAVSTDIYAQRIDSNGIIRWDDNGTSICTDSYSNYELKISSDGAGGAILAWETQIAGNNKDLYVQRIDSNGGEKWYSGGLVICDKDYYQQDIEIINNEIGGAIFTWEDQRTGTDFDIYAQRVDQLGNVKWTTNGKAICLINYYNTDPAICGDGADGAIICWADLRSGSDFDIYAQHINSNGDEQWIANGIPICNISIEFQEFPQICNDGGGGGIITWRDSRGPSNNIYAQRINSNGDTKWAINGVVIKNISGIKNYPLILNNEGESAIIIWQDERVENDCNIYAQRIVNDAPISNHPSDIETFTEGTETLNWILTDDSAGGKYHVLANNTSGDYYVTVDWTSWSNNTVLHVPINRTNPGFFNYTIEYYDDQNRFGVPDTVIVQITKPEDEGFKISGYNVIFIVLSFFAIALILTKKLKLRQKKQ